MPSEQKAERKKMMLEASFVPSAGSFESSTLWDPLLIPSEVIDERIEELASLPAGQSRRYDIVHPASSSPGRGLAPGIRVSIDVLLPGEEASLPPSNASEVNFCIRGAGVTLVGGRKFSFETYDGWNRPALAPSVHHNDRSELQARLTYSNAPLLERLHVHIFPPADQLPPEGAPQAESSADEAPSDSQPLGDTIEVSHPDTNDTLLLMPYEKVIAPPVVEQRAWHWPWQVIKEKLDEMSVLGKGYEGRRLYLMYNPATGRTHGTTNSFFATICLRPAEIVDRPHRHASAAINYFFAGRGDSMVGGNRYEWKAGDLMFTAPGWMIHRHASHDEPVYELTVQDSPFHIANNSLLWQENLKRPLRLLGSQEGFATSLPPLDPG